MKTIENFYNQNSECSIALQASKKKEIILWKRIIAYKKFMIKNKATAILLVYPPVLLIPHNSK